MKNNITENKPLIIGTGLNGLLGSRILEILKSKYSFQNLSRATNIDITNYSSIEYALSLSEASVVLHAAAYTDVKQAEKDKDLGKDSEAYKINVLGTKNVAKVCEKLNKKLIHVSTDMVLGGEEMPNDGFKEDSDYNPLSYYAKTKYEAELIVKKLSTPWIIIRPAYPYRANFEKHDFVRLFLELLKNKKPISALSDRIISPTLIDDLANALDILITKDMTGIYNTTGSQILSIYESVLLIAKAFNLETSLVNKITRKEFLDERAPEPFSSALNNDKIKKLGVEMHTFEEGLEIVKKQIAL